MNIFGSKVRVKIHLNEKTGLMMGLWFDNRYLKIQECARAYKEDRDIDLIQKEELEEIENGVFRQYFSVGGDLVRRDLHLIDGYKDRRGSKFRISVSCSKDREFDLEWGLKFENPDYFYGESKSGSSTQMFLTEGKFKLHSLDAEYIRIDEENGYTVLLPFELEKLHDEYNYTFEKSEGLCFLYYRNTDSSRNDIHIYGYLGISRRDEPIPDNSLILMDKNDWKSAVKSSTIPIDKSHLNTRIKNNYIFHNSNTFPMLYTEEDKKESLEEFLELGQSFKVLRIKSLSDRNQLKTNSIFENARELDPRFRWISSTRKFRFSILLPEDAIFSLPFILLIRDLNILPVFIEDLQNKEIHRIKESLADLEILVFHQDLSIEQKNFLKDNKFKTFYINLGGYEKSSVKILKSYLVIRTLDTLIEQICFLSQPNAPKRRLKDEKKIIIPDLIRKQLENTPKHITDLLEITSFSELFRKTLLKDYYKEIKDLENLVIGIEGINYRSSLKFTENNRITKLRRVSIVSTDLNLEDIISTIMYSLAFDTQVLLIDEKRLSIVSRGTIKKIFESIQERIDFRIHAINFLDQLNQSPTLSFVQKWSENLYPLEYSSSILEELNSSLKYSNKHIKNQIESSKGAISLFLSKEFPIEIVLGGYSENCFTFGRFFVNNSNLLRHQVRSALMQPRRSKNTLLNSIVITAEKDSKLIKGHEILKEILECHGKTKEKTESINKELIEKSFQENELIFFFVHSRNKKLLLDINDREITYGKEDIKEIKYNKGVLVLNSCKTGLDFTGVQDGISVSLSKYGFPLIIAPLQRVCYDTACLFSQIISVYLYERISISQIVSLAKRKYALSNDVGFLGYFVFGSPYIRFFTPTKHSIEKTNECLLKIKNKF